MPRVKTFDEKATLTRAMELFWRNGYAATSVQDLVSHLGINRASLYDTYGDKKQLFLKAFQLYRNINTEAVKGIFSSHTDVKQGLTAMFQTAIEEASSDVDRKGCFVVNTTTELVPNEEELLGVLQENHKNFTNTLIDYLKKGQQSGQLNSKLDVKAMAHLLFTLYTGIRVVSKVNSNENELNKSFEIALKLLDS